MFKFLILSLVLTYASAGLIQNGANWVSELGRAGLEDVVNIGKVGVGLVGSVVPNVNSAIDHAAHGNLGGVLGDSVGAVGTGADGLFKAAQDGFKDHLHHDSKLLHDALNIIY
ncbi:uncharacterized protein LOC128957234 [Oppia nitens]|uniref:uncharacterized protein LOC128957234 n=1 Tax=Oppia nitens TaxID=1686743 RepID=UPI0023DBD54C|nr:uncharacterized protein LOC128957234 [Oppia nitens]